MTAQDQPSGEEIATLAPDLLASALPINPRTGQPRRPVAVWVASVSCLLAVGFSIAGLLWTYASEIGGFTTAAWLYGRFGEAPDILTQVLLTVAATAAALVAAASCAITGYYAACGYGWTRISGIVSAVASFLVLLLNPLAWAAVPLALLGAGLLWLPSVRAFFDAWDARRHPRPDFAPPIEHVAYGPLPRYR